MSFSEKISVNLQLSVKIVFFAVPVDSAGYRIEEWKTVSVSDMAENDTLGVWDGGMLG